MARWHWSMLLLGAMVLLGCSAEETPETKNRASDPDATTSTSKDDKSDAAKSDSGEKKSAIETPANLAKLKPQSSTPKRDTFAGRWVFGGLQVLQGDGKNTPPQYGEMTEMIIGIQLNDADPAANSISVVAARDGIAKRSLKLTSIKDQKIEPWSADMRRLASLPNVACKLSGMVTEADWRSWTPAALKPYVDEALAAFGQAQK